MTPIRRRKDVAGKKLSMRLLRKRGYAPCVAYAACPVCGAGEMVPCGNGAKGNTHYNRGDVLREMMQSLGKPVRGYQARFANGACLMTKRDLLRATTTGPWRLMRTLNAIREREAL